MDLETFVENALAQIDSALSKASSKNPEKYNYTYWRNASWNEVIDFAGSVFSGKDTDIENKADHAVDTAKATFE